MKIAFLGLGRMGSGMAACIARAGQHTLTAWNRTPGKAAALKDLGAQVAEKPGHAVADADLVISSLMDDASVEDMFRAGGPVLAAMKPGAIHLCVTTISAACANRLQVLHQLHGTVYVSGPVLGRPDAASTGKLVQFLAGDAGAVGVVDPVCRSFAGQVIALPGPAGIANSQKLCINFFAAALIESMGECFTLAEKLGTPREVLSLFFEQSFALPVLKGYASRMGKREFDGKDGFAMTAGRKDLALMRDAAASVECPLDMADVILEKMDEAIENGLGHLDWSATQQITRIRAGLQGW